MIKILSLLFMFMSSMALGKVDFKKAFADRDACFAVTDLSTGKVVSEYNPERCEKRFTPCSSFKIAAALMGFEKGVLKDENQIIKWDGVKRSRPEENRDQTPLTWMSDSVKWVTEWIMPQLGEKTIQPFLKDFEYGNQDFSGGLKDSWVTSSLKISALEQIRFLSRFWKGELHLSGHTTELTKKIIFINKIGHAELYGKTGTGCLQGHACMDQPGKMIGTFVGVLKTPDQTYVFAANGADLKDQKRPGGPRMKETVIDLLKNLGLTSEK